METKVRVIEERISHSAHSIHLCFPSNISEPDSSVSDEPLPRFSLSIPSIFPATISESDNSSVSGERLPKFCPSIESIFPAAISESDSSSVSGERIPNFCPSIESIFPATSTQTNSPANNEIIPYNNNPIESCFPPRCDSDSDSLVPYDIIQKYLRSFSIQSYFPSVRSSTSAVASVYDLPSPSVDSDNSFNFESYPNGLILEKPNLKEFTFADLKTTTRNFFELDSLLDEGGFGRVSKGWMDERTLSPSKSMQGLQEWQVHSSMCTELMKFVGRISRIFPEMEAARPRCSSGIQTLCLLNLAIEKAKQLLQDCSESSKLYLVCNLFSDKDKENTFDMKNLCVSHQRENHDKQTKREMIETQI